jgi:hypothetical protein
MNGQNRQNIQKLLASVPPGYIVDSRWLQLQGIGRRSAYAYVQRGWLQRLAHGVYRRPVPVGSRSNQLDWQTSVLSMQHIMRYPLHVGGITALRLQGFGHFVVTGGQEVVLLYGQKIPTWLAKIPIDAVIATRKSSLFADLQLGLVDDKFSTHGAWGWRLRVSAPERAILEALDELPSQLSFEMLDLVFESLTTLRPKLLTELLGSCKKIKVKRLFFVFADRYGHAWRSQLNPEAFDLGRGDRSFVKGGRIHPRYRITVPDAFATSAEGLDHAD